MLLINAALVPVESPRIDNGYIRILDQKIAAFGPMPAPNPDAVSYTHLDVYKRQLPGGMGSEDFSLVTEKVPGIFLRLGAMPSDPEKVFPAHNPNVLFDESAFPIGSAVYANAAIQWLKNNQ